MLLELKARLLRLAASTRGAPRGARVQRVLASAGGAAPSKVEQMASFVALHYREPIDLDDVAQSVGFASLSHFIARYRQAFGKTPAAERAARQSPA